MERIFDELELRECFENLEICGIGDLLERLKDNYSKTSSEKVKDKVELRTYKLLKSAFGTEEYIKLNLDRSDRSFMAQFRLGILLLHVETGRFNGTPLENRLCKLCSDGVVEDETHFLLYCNKYDGEREILFSKASSLNY